MSSNAISRGVTTPAARATGAATDSVRAYATPSGDDRSPKRIDAPEGRTRYEQRFGAVEPVFANLRYNKGLNRFTLRGRIKVDAQWKLFCLVHNIEKLAHQGYGR